MTNKYIVLIFFILLTIPTVNACSCRYLEEFTQEEFNELGVIFTGQVVDKYYDTLIERDVIKFSVIEFFKGKSIDGFVYALNAEGNCRIYVDKGEYFLFFLYGKVEQPEISMCSRKIEIEEISSFTPPDWLTKCANKPNGLDKSYYSKKKLASEGNLINQKPEGKWKYYHKNGYMTSTGYYKNGLKDSIWAYYDEDGNKLAIISFKQDKQHGKEVLYYENGNIEAEEYYLDGLEHGYGYGLYEDGTKRWEAQSDKGVSIEHTLYYENGQKKTYQNQTLEMHWYESGTKDRERHFNKRKKNFDKFWWENGQLKQIRTYNEKGEVMVIYAAKENGEVMVENGTGYYDMWGEQGECKDSLKVGTWRQKFNNGEVVETEYRNGIEVGIIKRWDKDGKLIFEAE